METIQPQTKRYLFKIFILLMILGQLNVEGNTTFESNSICESGVIKRGPYLSLDTTTQLNNEIKVRWRTDEEESFSFCFKEITASNYTCQTITGTTTTIAIPYDFLGNLTTCDVIDYEATVPISSQNTYNYEIRCLNGLVLKIGEINPYPTNTTEAPLNIWITGDGGYAHGLNLVEEAYSRYLGDVNLDGLIDDKDISKKSDFILMLGDNAYAEQAQFDDDLCNTVIVPCPTSDCRSDGGDFAYQKAIFDQQGEIFKNNIMWTTIGNHEVDYKMFDRNYHEFAEIFPYLPENKGYYSFDYGKVHFVCLNSEIGNSFFSETAIEMKNWLVEDLTASKETAEWTIVYFHHPIHTASPRAQRNTLISDANAVTDLSKIEFDMRTMINNFAEIVDTFEVDLVMTAHAHHYERSFLIDGYYNANDPAQAVFDENNPDMLLDDGCEGCLQAYDNDPLNYDYENFNGSYFTKEDKGTVYMLLGASGKLDVPAVYHDFFVHPMMRPFTTPTTFSNGSQSVTNGGKGLFEIGSANLAIRNDSLVLEYIVPDNENNGYVVRDKFTIYKPSECEDVPVVLNTTTICNDPSEGETNVVLESLVVTGTTNGIFTDAMNNVVEVVDGSTLPIGDYTYSYIIQGVCEIEEVTTTVTVTECEVILPCPLNLAAPIVNDFSICEGDAPPSLSPSIDFVLEEPYDFHYYDADPASGDANLLGTGSSFTVELNETWVTVVIDENGCESPPVISTLNINASPTVIIENAIVCNNSNDGNTSVELISLITEGPTDGEFVGIFANIGGDPAMFNGVGVAVGDYVITYVLPAIENCAMDSTEFFITVSDCITFDPCENFNEPVIEGTTYCENQAHPINPSGGGIGDTVIYNFYDSDPMTGGLLLATGATFEPEQSGEYWITAVEIDGTCESSAIVINVNILTEALPADIESVTVCNNDDTENNSIILTSLITDGITTGVFTNNDGDTLTVFEAIDLNEGIYELTYTISVTCGDAITQFFIIVEDNCTMNPCDNFEVPIIENLNYVCKNEANGETILVLSNLIIEGATGGTFFDEDGTEVTVIDGTVLEIGSYTYTYEFTEGCISSYPVNIEVIDCMVQAICTSINSENTDLTICSGESIDLAVIVENVEISEITWSTGETNTTDITVSNLENLESCDPIIETITASIPNNDPSCNEPTSISFDITILPDPSNGVEVIESDCSVTVTACEGAIIGYEVEDSGLIEESTYNVNPPLGTTVMVENLFFEIFTDCGIDTLVINDLTCEGPNIHSIGDFVWQDDNENGIQDPGEIGIEGVNIFLYNENDEVILQTTTDEAGFYAFYDINVGNYYMKFEFPTDYEIVTPNIGESNTDSDINANGFTEVFTITETTSNLDIDAGAFVNPCLSFEAVESVICSENQSSYQILLFFEGGDANNMGYIITNNLTSVVTTTIESSYLFGPFENNSGGFSYTINPVNNPQCTQVLSAPLVDCVFSAVELLEFDGEVKDEGNSLFWSTASERDNDHFTLMRSVDGENFEPINTQQGAGTSNITNHYGFLDETAPNGFSYYRLDQTDFDGTTSRSNIVVLWRGEVNNSTINIDPIPATNIINLSYLTESNTQVEIQIFDAIGRLVKTEKIEVIEGINQQQINISTYSTGIYFLSIQNGEETITKKFVKE